VVAGVLQLLSLPRVFEIGQVF